MEINFTEKRLFDESPNLRDAYRVEKIKSEYPEECHGLAKQYYQCADYYRSIDKPQEELETCLEQFNLNKCLDENKEDKAIEFWLRFKDEEARKAAALGGDEDEDEDEEEDD